MNIHVIHLSIIYCSNGHPLFSPHSLYRNCSCFFMSGIKKKKPYPAVSPLYCYNYATNQEKATQLITSRISLKGQNIIKNDGYILMK